VVVCLLEGFEDILLPIVVWLCVIVCGCVCLKGLRNILLPIVVWLCVVVCGCVWLCVVVCGCVWLCLFEGFEDINFYIYRIVSVMQGGCNWRGCIGINFPLPILYNYSHIFFVRFLRHDLYTYSHY
jgi:hypothetical protein